MVVTRDELVSFNEFVNKQMNNGSVALSLEDCLYQWRAERDRAETIASVQRGVEDIEAGRWYSLDEMDQHIREELGFSPRPQ